MFASLKIGKFSYTYVFYCNRWGFHRSNFGFEKILYTCGKKFGDRL